MIRESAGVASALRGEAPSRSFLEVWRGASGIEQRLQQLEGRRMVRDGRWGLAGGQSVPSIQGAGQRAPSGGPSKARQVPGALGTRVADSMVDDVTRAQRQMDAVLAAAKTGKSFSPAELLGLQAQMYRSAQLLDLSSKAVEKTTGGIRQLLQTQV